MHDLVLVRDPGPQDVEHGPATHSPHTGSTVRINEKYNSIQCNIIYNNVPITIKSTDPMEYKWLL